MDLHEHDYFIAYFASETKIAFFFLPDALSHTQNAPKMLWQLGLCPIPHWGAHDAPQNP